MRQIHRSTDSVRSSARIWGTATADRGTSAAADAVASASRDTVVSLVERGLTMRDLGRLMGISPQRVSQIHAEAARSAA